jgi:hypothetical protein
MESSNPAGVRQAVPLYLVRHMQACIDFYVKGLGFDVTNTWLVDGEIRWCWMSMGDAAMMFQELAPASTSPNGTDQKLGLGVELCLQCDNALLMYERAMANKLAVQDPFVGNNMRVDEHTEMEWSWSRCVDDSAPAKVVTEKRPKFKIIQVTRTSDKMEFFRFIVSAPSVFYIQFGIQ